MMISAARCFMAECQKCKHSSLYYLHWVIPAVCAVVFASYYHAVDWEASVKVSAYLQILAVSFPFLIGIIVGLAIQIENNAGHFQLMLGIIPSRAATYIGKLGFLFISACGASVLAFGIFAALYRTAPVIFYVKAGFFLLLTVFPLYFIHLFVALRWGKGASMGLGIAGSLFAALMITGLGDAVWKYIPWAWGVRAMDYTVLAWNRPDLYIQVQSDFFSGITICAISTICLLAVSLVWYRVWEGENNYD